MIIVLKPDAGKDHAERIMARISEQGCKPLYLPGTERVVLGAIGDERVLAALNLLADPQVESVKAIVCPYKQVSREFHPHDTIVSIGGVNVGGDRFVVIAGPCAVESREQLTSVAECVKREGAACIRASAFTPRTNPYAFQGLGQEGLQLLVEVAQAQKLPCVTEVISAEDLQSATQRADALVVDESNIQNFRLLKALGQGDRPVLLERGRAGDLKQLLVAAEVVTAEGNSNVVLCERGIRTFETATTNTLDLSAVPYLKKHAHLPVLVDVSRSTGDRDLVAPMAKAAAACGADGIIVQVHPDPGQALSGGPEALYPEQFAELMHGLRPFVAAAGRLP